MILRYLFLSIEGRIHTVVRALQIIFLSLAIWLSSKWLGKINKSDDSIPEPAMATTVMVC